jgi:hypothetical protein
MSKSDIVRQYLSKKPLASVQQIITDLKAHKISEALASKIKYSERIEAPKPRGRKPGRKPGPKPARTPAPAHSSAKGEKKADAIRDMAKTMKKPIRPRDVRAALAEKGIDASYSLVSQVLKSMGMRRKRRKRKAAAGAAPAAAASTAGLNINDLVAAKKLVAEVGSIEKVREALAALARLR